MTKYILHGGFSRVDNKLNAEYYQEITKDLSAGAKVLVILFSREEEEYDDLFKQEKGKILKSADNKQLEVQLASEDNFIEQVENADALVIRGGGTQKLISTLKKYPGFSNVIKGKVVAGSSAGAYILSTYYHSASADKIDEGLGILPLRVICHFQSDQFNVTEKAIEAINKYPEGLELVVLKDYQWRVFIK
jgi:peptidase E